MHRVRPTIQVWNAHPQISMTVPLTHAKRAQCPTALCVKVRPSVPCALMATSWTHRKSASRPSAQGSTPSMLSASASLRTSCSSRTRSRTSSRWTNWSSQTWGSPWALGSSWKPGKTVLTVECHNHLFFSLMTMTSQSLSCKLPKAALIWLPRSNSTQMPQGLHPLPLNSQVNYHLILGNTWKLL